MKDMNSRTQKLNTILIGWTVIVPFFTLLLFNLYFRPTTTFETVGGIVGMWILGFGMLKILKMAHGLHNVTSGF
jgi:hypothetical protein